MQYRKIQSKVNKIINNPYSYHLESGGKNIIILGTLLEMQLQAMLIKVEKLEDLDFEKDKTAILTQIAAPTIDYICTKLKTSEVTRFRAFEIYRR